MGLCGHGDGMNMDNWETALKQIKAPPYEYRRQKRESFVDNTTKWKAVVSWGRSHSRDR